MSCLVSELTVNKWVYLIQYKKIFFLYYTFDREQTKNESTFSYHDLSIWSFHIYTYINYRPPLFTIFLFISHYPSVTPDHQTRPYIPPVFMGDYPVVNSSLNFLLSLVHWLVRPFFVRLVPFSVCISGVPVSGPHKPVSFLRSHRSRPIRSVSLMSSSRGPTSCPRENNPIHRDPFLHLKWDWLFSSVTSKDLLFRGLNWM